MILYGFCGEIIKDLNGDFIFYRIAGLVRKNTEQ